jgi:four helix bundle protein
MKSYMDVEDLEVYQKLCRLHIEICDLSHEWPNEEKYEIASQIRRSSNSSPAQLAEKNDDRHVRNKIEGVNRSRGEAAETIHHLFMAREKGYITAEIYESFRTRYKECIRMLNGLEKTLERKLPEGERRWVVRDRPQGYSVNSELVDSGWPIPSETRNPKPYALFVYRLHHHDGLSVRRCTG